MSRHTKPLPQLEDLIATLRALLPELQDRWHVHSLGVFGSYVRGEQRRSSDLDLLVEFDDYPLSLLDIIRLENYLSDLLGVRGDLVERRALKPAIGRHILAEVQPL
jgi:predicted nucleotidyltransferase